MQQFGIGHACCCTNRTWCRQTGWP